MHRWFVAGVLCWGASAMEFVVHDVPVPDRVFEWLTGVAGNAYVPCFVVAFHRALDLRRRRLERGLLAVVAAFAVQLALVPPLRHFAVFFVWLGVTIGLAVYLLGLLWRAARDGRYPVLGMVRSRIEPRLARHGIRFDWQVGDLPRIPGFGPERVLQALRILQEAITNVAKHARARTIVVRTGLDAGGVFIEVRHDGVGLDGTGRRGRGIASMHRRAAALIGRLVLAPAAPGTAVRLWLPLDA